MRGPIAGAKWSGFCAAMHLPRPWLGATLALGLYAVLVRIGLYQAMVGFAWPDDLTACGIWLWVAPLICGFLYLLAWSFFRVFGRGRGAVAAGGVAAVILLAVDSVDMLGYAAMGRHLDQISSGVSWAHLGYALHVLAGQGQQLCLAGALVAGGMLATLAGWKVRPGIVRWGWRGVLGLLIPGMLWLGLAVAGVQRYSAAADWGARSLWPMPYQVPRVWSMHRVPDELRQIWRRFRAAPVPHPDQNEIPSGNAKRPVAVLVLESFRHDALNPRWMPTVCAFLNHAVVFERHMSSGNCTEAGMYGLLGGGYFWERPTRAMKNADALRWTRNFSQAGYACSGAFSCVGVFSLDPKTWKWNGLDTFFNAPPLGEFITFFGANADENDAVAHDQAALRWMMDKARGAEAKKQTPAMLAFLYGTHIPYYHRGPVAALDAIDQGNAVNYFCLKDLARYKSSVRQMDEEISTILPELLDAGYWVVLTGDHAESFGMDGCVAHDNGRLSCGQSNVPLVVFGHDLAPLRVSACTSHVQAMDLLGDIMSSGAPKLRPGKGCSFVWRAGHGMWDFGPDMLLHVEVDAAGEIQDAYYTDDRNHFRSVSDTLQREHFRRIEQMCKPYR